MKRDIKVLSEYFRERDSLPAPLERDAIPGVCVCGHRGPFKLRFKAHVLYRHCPTCNDAVDMDKRS
ncbi:Uncharacterised protein [Brevibacillus brevis]|nr:Uncharacterised protein [Brevibacillus brevis]